MDGAVKNFVGVGLSLPIMWFCMLSSAFAQSQDLRDPTRPPHLVANGAVEVIDQPVLQSILIGPDRKFAIINGKTVKLNGKYGDQLLVKLTESEAVLKRGKELQTLKLFPNIDKKIVRSNQTK